jgi:hypothetical protein
MSLIDLNLPIAVSSCPIHGMYISILASLVVEGNYYFSNITILDIFFLSFRFDSSYSFVSFITFPDSRDWCIDNSHYSLQMVLVSHLTGEHVLVFALKKILFHDHCAGFLKKSSHFIHNFRMFSKLHHAIQSYYKGEILTALKSKMARKIDTELK